MILASSATQKGHLSSAFDQNDQSSSDGDIDHCSILTEKEKMGIAQAVRIFGGVIIGAAAEEIARSIQPASIPRSAQDDDMDSAHDAGYRSDPVVASFGIAPPSPLHQSDDSSETSGGGDLDGADFEGAEASHESFLPQRREGQKKRKIADRGTGDKKGSFVSECDLPTDLGLFRLRSYRFVTERKTHEPVVMIAGDIRGGSSVPVRVHDQCQTSEVFGSRRCDCREQLDTGLRYIQKNGGAVIYLAQEGRGIGLANKVAAYALQDGGADTVDANRRLGFKDDERTYECVKDILQDMGIKSIRLMTNNPFKIVSLKALGINVDGRIPIQMPSNTHNKAYLDAKVNRMGHLINNL